MSALPGSVPQLTLRAIVLAIVLAMILAAANAYLGLFAGMTIASAIPSAVVSMAVLRALGGGGILENNIVQTGGSAGGSVTSGVIFTIPALVVLGFWKHFDYGWVLAIAGLGGVLGVLFSVPLRRSLIIDQQLAFPEGKAAAEVLRAGENPAQGVKVLAGAALGGGLAKLAAGSGLRLIPDTAALAGYFGPAIGYVGTNLSGALLGVGYIVGFNIGVVVVAGSVISWNVVIPLYGSLFLSHNATLAHAVAGLNAGDTANLLWSRHIRYLGVGAMLVGGIWTIIRLRSSLLSGVRSGLAVRRGAAATAVAERERDLPMQWILTGIVLFTVPLWLLYQSIVGSLAVSVPMTIIMIVAGFIFCSVSAYMAGLVGSSNNPVSGITIATILFAAVVLLALMGRQAVLGPIATIMIGAVVCCAACIAGDNLQDLKAGYLIGATPWKQQVMLAIGTAACAVVMAPVLNLLEAAYGIGVPSAAHPNPLLAPQATLMAFVAKGLFGGSLPWNMISIGGALGIGIIVLDEILRIRGSSFRCPVLAAAVGIYLPMEVTMPIFLGGTLAWYAERRLRRAAPAGRTPSTEDIERMNRRGVLFAAGLITGEALMGIVIAVPIVLAGRADVLALPASLQFGQWLGVIVLIVLGALLYRAATEDSPRTPTPTAAPLKDRAAP
ncbi:MAG TPA: oligopeptide transporter, OPT family [Steroidobacteraceae bacterium]|nr:oligopeptide transporter, OPT family [Steroidobacteraceae bacterium]